MRSALGEDDPAGAGILKEAEQAPVAPHLDKGDHVDEQARRRGGNKAVVEQLRLVRHLREDGAERLVEHFEARDLRAAQVHQHG